MFRAVRSRIKPVLIFSYITYLIILSSCSFENDEPTYKEISPSEILSFFINRTTGERHPNGNYIFVCGPCCKTCVQKTLSAINTLFKHNTIPEKDNWTFITSHDFVKAYPLSDIDFILDRDWEIVNYNFADVVLIRFINDQIIYSGRLAFTGNDFSILKE